MPLLYYIKFSGHIELVTLQAQISVHKKMGYCGFTFCLAEVLNQTVGGCWFWRL